MVKKAIQSEMNYLEAQGLGFKDIESTTIALKTLSHQCAVCYVSSGEVPVIPLMRHMSGYLKYYLDSVSVEINGPRYIEQANVGAYLILLDSAVKRLCESVQNSARGDAIEQAGVIMSILQSCMNKYGVEMRQGFEI